jgi:AICAR transformylase/IMP cyclohydrolase PurH
MEAALNEVDGKDFAFAVVRSCDDEAWQILAKKKNITTLQIERYTNRDDAVNAGVALVRPCPLLG